ncbi:MAG: PHP domain-containing protein [Thermodesulfobacteriota bacterium]
MKIDLHVHTTAFSPCSVMSPDEAARAAAEAGLDAICITEHNRLWTTDDARALSGKHGLQVFSGMEVTTTGGDILVFGLEEEPHEMWTPAELREKVDRAGGVAIAAHPFRGFLLFGFGTLQMDLSQAIGNPTFSQVHGLEVCNSLVTDEENEMARRVADEMGLLKLGGSDAHNVRAVGTCITDFQDDIRDEKDLIAAILSGRHTTRRMK